MTTTISCNENNLVFTRYLYVKLEVKHSLLIAILNKNVDEALFWLYELYYSGFQEEIPEYLEKIFDEFFSAANPRYIKLMKRVMSYEKPTDKQLGAVVMTLCMLTYRAHGFVKSYFNVKCKPSISSPSTKRPLFIVLKASDIETYQTLPIMDPPRLYLKEVCKYSIHKEINSLFDLSNFDFRDIYRDMDRWIYYAYRSPVWEKRVVGAGGKLDHNKKAVVFENDEAHDEFWDIWNIETDEQLVSVSEKSTGNNKEPQWTVTDFCKQYGAEQITKRISREPTVLLRTLPHKEDIRKGGSGSEPLVSPTALSNTLVQL